MKPYYSDSGIVIYHGDCRDVLPGLEPESVTLLWTDPPYGHANQDGDLASSRVGVKGGRQRAAEAIANDTAANMRDQVRPRFAFVENSADLAIRGLGRVLGDLAEMGYNARWGVFSAADVGARHERERIWIIAHTTSESWLHEPDFGERAQRLPDHGSPWEASPWDEATPRVCRMDDGLADRVERTERIGNGQVPAVVRLAWDLLEP